MRVENPDIMTKKAKLKELYQELNDLSKNQTCL